VQTCELKISINSSLTIIHMWFNSVLCVASIYDITVLSSISAVLCDIHCIKHSTSQGRRRFRIEFGTLSFMFVTQEERGAFSKSQSRRQAKFHAHSAGDAHLSWVLHWWPAAVQKGWLPCPGTTKETCFFNLCTGSCVAPDLLHWTTWHAPPVNAKLRMYISTFWQDPN